MHSGLHVNYINYYVLFTGAVFHYMYLTVGYLWTTHIIGVLWGMMFPFHARTFQQKAHFKYLHIGMVTLAMVLPFVAVAVIIGIGGSAATSSPPFLCVAKNIDVLFYTTIPPGCLVFGIGIPVIVTMFSIRIHVRRTKTPQQNKCAKEKVIILVLSNH